MGIKILHQSVGPNNLRPRVSVNGRPMMVHQLVARAFLGLRPEGQVTRHLDDDVMNNSISNLAYGTKSENREDAVRNGRNFWKNQTHCINGHEFTPENTRETEIQRHCRQCQRDNTARARARRKEQGSSLLSK
jgi:hypothetical protein